MIGKTFGLCIDFFNTVLSAYVKLRELHFNTTIQAQHDLTNDAMPALMDYADSIMENAMGMFGRPGMGILTCTTFEASTIKSVFESLRGSAIEFETFLSRKESNAGLVNILDDMILALNKWIYLSENT